jgi:ubiquinone/menaquinone biosynthesis C-methylase UbiE
LAVRGITVNKNALDILTRFLPRKYQEFSALCDRIAAFRAGQIEIIFASPAEMFALDFSALTDEQITPQEGTVDFRLICDQVRCQKSLTHAEAVSLAPPGAEAAHLRIETVDTGMLAYQPQAISRLPRYLEESEVREISLRDRRKISLEVILPRDGLSLQQYFETQPGGKEKFAVLFKDCCIVSALSSGVNKDESVAAYLSSATIFLAARDMETQAFIGYVAAQPIMISGMPVVFIWADYNLAQYHGLGMGTTLGAEAVKLGRKILGAKLRSRTYISYRTWNPAAYKISRRGDFALFPMPNRDGTGVAREPTPAEARIFTKVAQDFLHTTVDVNTAILEDKVTVAREVTWLKIPRIDRFFRDFVKIAEGRAILVTARTAPFFELLHPLREWGIRFGTIFGLFMRSLPLMGRLFKSRETRVDWGKYFEAYDVLREFIPYQLLLKRMADLLDLKADAVCVDLGSGTGNMALELEQRGAKVVSVDNSPEGIAIHQKKSLGAQILTINLDYEKTGFLPFADGSVDRISANHVVNYIKNRQNLYQELRRVIKADGVIVLSVLRKGFNPLKVLLGNMRLEYQGFRDKGDGIWAALKKVHANFNRRHPHLNIVGEANKVIVEGAASGKYVLFNEKQIREELEAAGFAIVSIEPHYAGQDLVVKIKPK